MSHNPNPEMAGRGLSIAIASGLIVTGVILALLPLFLPSFTAIGRSEAYSFAHLTHWFGMVIALVGLSVLLARIIRIDAVGAGNMKFMGFELPIEVGGAMFVLFFLLLGGAAVTFGAGLHDVEDRYLAIEAATDAETELFVRSHPEYTKLSELLDEANLSVDSLQVELVEMNGRRAALRAILQAGLDQPKGVELMRMQVDCGDRGKYWIDWPEARPNQREVTAILRPDVDPADVGPFRVYYEATTYNLYLANATGSTNRIISFNLSLDRNNVLTGTFQATGRSLEDFCRSFDPSVRDIAADRSLDHIDVETLAEGVEIPSEAVLAADAAADN